MMNHRPKARVLLRAIGNEIVEKAKEHCPVRTGTLRDSIRILEVNDDGVEVGSDVPYAHFVEYGTEKMSPRAFLRRAVREVVQ